MAKTKKSAKAALSETLEEEEEEYVVENPSLESDLQETIVVQTSQEKLELTEAKPKKNGNKRTPVKAIIQGEKVITEVSDDARELYNQSRFGTLIENGKVELTLLEALYLFEKERLDLRSESGRKISFESYIKKARKVEPQFWIRYSVYKDIRNRGYIIKTALKFGADFRVYDRGIKPGEDHARWIVYPVHEGSTLTWYEFAAKNRVAHSTKKRLLMGIVDGEGDVTYYEIRWMKP